MYAYADSRIAFPHFVLFSVTHMTAGDYQDFPTVVTGMVDLAPKWVRLDPKLDKSGTFSDQISVHLAHLAKCTEI